MADKGKARGAAGGSGQGGGLASFWVRIARLAAAIWTLPARLEEIAAAQEKLTASLAAKADCREVEDLRARLAQKEDRDALPERLYFRFEERFRGRPEEVKKRLFCYLPLLAALAPAERPLAVLDLGCGRGDWLELLAERGWSACGVDTSRQAVAHCRSRGLAAVEADCLAYVRAAAPGSLDAVTALHLAEHLPLGTLLELLAAARAALRPGGILILETPNPINILVSACDFLRDPTHRRPLHPDTLRFLAEEMGFSRAEAYFVGAGDWAPAPPDGILPLIKASDWRLDEIHDYTRAPRDFALIAYK